MVSFTVRTPGLPKACVTVRPSAVPPSPKSHAKASIAATLASTSVAEKVTVWPASTSQLLLKLFWVAPVTL